jgi:SPP1 gp7 family putative phage head morphogenesis protein
MAENQPIDIDTLAMAVYHGSITPRKLPREVYHVNARKIIKGVYEGYKKQLKDVAYGSPDYTMLNNLRNNVYMFSAAKTFSQVMQMSDSLVKDDKVIPFTEFKNIVQSISDEYNVNYLAAEYGTAIAAAENASSWLRFEDQKQTLPYLKYSTIGDACDICAPLDGTTLKVDDPFWNTFYPPNHFNCRCLCTQEDDDAMETDSSVIDSREEKVGERMDDTFKINTGKREEIFSKDHPYFIVPKEYQDFARTNFGLEIPKTDE